MKLRYTGRVRDVGARDTRTVQRNDNTATGPRDAMSLRTRNVGEIGPVRWNGSGPRDTGYLMHMAQQGGAHTVGHLDDLGYLRPEAQGYPEGDPPKPGMYIVPT